MGASCRRGEKSPSASFTLHSSLNLSDENIFFKKHNHKGTSILSGSDDVCSYYDELGILNPNSTKTETVFDSDNVKKVESKPTIKVDGDWKFSSDFTLPSAASSQEYKALRGVIEEEESQPQNTQMPVSSPAGSVEPVDLYDIGLTSSSKKEDIDGKGNNSKVAHMELSEGRHPFSNRWRSKRSRTSEDRFSRWNMDSDRDYRRDRYGRSYRDRYYTDRPYFRNDPPDRFSRFHDQSYVVRREVPWRSYVPPYYGPRPYESRQFRPISNTGYGQPPTTYSASFRNLYNPGVYQDPWGYPGGVRDEQSDTMNVTFSPHPQYSYYPQQIRPPMRQSYMRQSPSCPLFSRATLVPNSFVREHQLSCPAFRSLSASLKREAESSRPYPPIAYDYSRSPINIEFGYPKFENRQMYSQVQTSAYNTQTSKNICTQCGVCDMSSSHKLGEYPSFASCPTLSSSSSSSFCQFVPQAERTYQFPPRPGTRSSYPSLPHMPL